MKQAQSGTSSHLLAGRPRWWPPGAVAPRPMGPGLRRMATGAGSRPSTSGVVATVVMVARAMGIALAALWYVATLPFRLLFLAIAWLGRAAAFVTGFALMVGGMFFLAGPFFLLGIPMFLIGLILTLRSLD